LDRPIAARAAHVADDLFEGHLDEVSETLVLEDRDVLEAHQRLEDLTKVHKDERCFLFLAHTTSPKRHHLIPGDLGRRDLPLQSEEPPNDDESFGGEARTHN
jgi:hypothetical protein